MKLDTHQRSEKDAGATSISVQSIVKNYAAFRALDSVSIDIRPREFVALLGPSGSGKTTLLMVIAGFSRPDSGHVRFGERDVTLTAPHKRDVGVVFQNYALFPHMTVGGNVAYPLKLRRVGTRDMQERVRRTLELVQLAGFEDRRIDQLSGGQRQRVALARAVVYEPKILLMDEPLSALDKKLREQMQMEVRQLHDQLGITTVYVTHDQREALTMADRVAVLNHGRIVQEDSPREIYENPRTEFVADFIGDCHFIPVEIRNGIPYFGDMELRVATPVDDAGPPDRLIVVRPEKIRVLPAPVPGELNCFRGVVRHSVYQGESALLHVDIVDGGRVAVRQVMTSGIYASMPKASDPVWLGMEPGDTILVAREAAG